MIEDWLKDIVGGGNLRVSIGVGNYEGCLMGRARVLVMIFFFLNRGS